MPPELQRLLGFGKAGNSLGFVWSDDPLSDPLAACDAAIGSRFLNMVADQIPTWRRLVNRTLTVLANMRYVSDVSELHSGARAFRALGTASRVQNAKLVPCRRPGRNRARGPRLAAPEPPRPRPRATWHPPSA